MLPRRPLHERERVNASGLGPDRGIDDWASEVRNMCLDNLQRSRTRSRRATLKDRLFPLNTSHPLDLDAVLYSESAWAAGTLAVCFLSFFLLTGSLWSAIAFVLVASILITPILVVWAGLGYYYV